MNKNDAPQFESSKPEYWEKSYKSGDMGWDIGAPTPVFNSWIQMQKESLSICILGAGNGWDALNFAEKGHKVTAVDFAESAILNMNVLASKRKLNLNILHMDIFKLDKIYTNTFDIVLEYTCFCAIDPGQRQTYISLVKNILNPSGMFVGLFFPTDKILDNDGPPFGVNIDATLNLFSQYFTVIKKEIPSNSIEQRKGREIFLILKKNGD